MPPQSIGKGASSLASFPIDFGGNPGTRGFYQAISRNTARYGAIKLRGACCDQFSIPRGPLGSQRTNPSEPLRPPRSSRTCWPYFFCPFNFFDADWEHLGIPEVSHNEANHIGNRAFSEFSVLWCPHFLRFRSVEFPQPLVFWGDPHFPLFPCIGLESLVRGNSALVIGFLLRPG